MAVIAKNADGTISPKAGGGVEPLGGLTGTAVGALIGVLGGPVGVALALGWTAKEQVLRATPAVDHL